MKWILRKIRAWFFVQNIGLTAYRYNRLTDSMERADIAVDAFGKYWIDVVWENIIERQNDRD